MKTIYAMILLKNGRVVQDTIKVSKSLYRKTVSALEEMQQGLDSASTIHINYTTYRCSEIAGLCFSEKRANLPKV